MLDVFFGEQWTMLLYAVCEQFNDTFSNNIVLLNLSSLNM